MSDHRYLAVKNWESYQATMRRGSAIQGWIKVRTNRCDDSDFSTLTHFQRSVLTELWCVRARTGKNIHNDVTYILRATHTVPTDAPHLRHAIATLVSRGFLILTNQEVTLSEEKRIEEIRGEERRKGGRREEDNFEPTDDSDLVIEEIARMHPRNWRLNGVMDIPVVQSEAIACAIARHGPELVKQGTARFAEAVKKWPEHERKFIRDPVRFWKEADYLRDPKEWETKQDAKQSEISEAVRRAARAVAGADDQ